MTDRTPDQVAVRICECGEVWAGGNAKYCPNGDAYRFHEVTYVPQARLTEAEGALQEVKRNYICQHTEKQRHSRWDHPEIDYCPRCIALRALSPPTTEEREGDPED